MQLLAVACAAGFNLTACNPGSDKKKQTIKPQASSTDPYDIGKFGNVSLLHITDCHAQLMPLWFREPNINLGIGPMRGKPPHLVCENFLKRFNVKPGSMEAHAFTHLDFVEAAKKFGKVGGFAHLASLVKSIRAQRPGSLFLDGGDSWQGSATSLWTQGLDMVDASILMGVDVMTGHWEFTYGAEKVVDHIEHMKGKIDFVAQNVFDKDWGERIFNPYVIKNVNGINVGIIGQAFPYTPVANPRHLIPQWSFGIRESELIELIPKVREKGAEIIVLLSHNGMDVDLKLAGRVSGIDVILGGHTHDAIPQALPIKNASGHTLVINSGSNGKFLSVLDLDFKNGKIAGHKFSLLPIFSNILKADPEMTAYINKVREPHLSKLNEKLAVTEDLLYRRGNFNGTFDQLIMNAMLKVQEAEIAFSPGFRWGVSVLPGEPITFEQVMTQTAITYPAATLNDISGEQIKAILEDVGDNLFNVDPYYQQGGDMVRVAGLQYRINPALKIGKRIDNMTLNDKPLDPKKKYKVAGWASVAQNPQGKPIWDVVVEYLKDKKTIKIDKLDTPEIVGQQNNPGIENI